MDSARRGSPARISGFGGTGLRRDRVVDDVPGPPAQVTVPALLAHSPGPLHSETCGGVVGGVGVDLDDTCSSPTC